MTTSAATYAGFSASLGSLDSDVRCSHGIAVGMLNNGKTVTRSSLVEWVDAYGIRCIEWVCQEH